MGFTVDKSSHDQLFRDVKVQRGKAMVLAVEQVGKEAVNMVTKLTSRTAPPVRKGEGERRKHIGNWADITGNLARSIDSEVHVEGASITLTWGVIRRKGLRGVGLEDVVEYAGYLDERRGINVLGGIERVVQKKVRKAVQMVFDQVMIS